MAKIQTKVKLNKHGHKKLVENMRKLSIVPNKYKHLYERALKDRLFVEFNEKHDDRDHRLLFGQVNREMFSSLRDIRGSLFKSRQGRHFINNRSYDKGGFHSDLQMTSVMLTPKGRRLLGVDFGFREAIDKSGYPLSGQYKKTKYRLPAAGELDYKLLEQLYAQRDQRKAERLAKHEERKAERLLQRALRSNQLRALGQQKGLKRNYKLNLLRSRMAALSNAALTKAARAAHEEFPIAIKGIIGWRNLTGNAYTGLMSSVTLKLSSPQHFKYKSVAEVAGHRRRGTRRMFRYDHYGHNNFAMRQRGAKVWVGRRYGEDGNAEGWFAISAESSGMMDTSGNFAYDDARKMLDKATQQLSRKAKEEERYLVFHFVSGAPYVESLATKGGEGNIMLAGKAIARKIVGDNIKQMLKNKRNIKRK